MEKKKMYIVSENVCGERVRIGRALHKPPLTQEELSEQLNLAGYDFTPTIISRIERKERHVIDAELKALAKVLGVSMEWLTDGGEVEI